MKTRIILLVVWLIVFFSKELVAQCVPTSSSTFALPAVACPDEALNFINPHSSGFNYEWDFCTEDMLTTPSVTTSLFGLLGADIPVHTQIVEENGLYYLFVISRNNSKLYRIDLGNSPQNTPTSIADLGTITGGNYAEPIVILKDNGNWYGFTCNVLSNNNFTKITFGSSITNMPTYSFFGNITSVVTFTRAFDIFKEGSNYYLAAVGTTSNKVAIFDLGTNLASATLNTSSLVREDTFTNINTPLCLRARKDCNGWNIIVASSNNRNFVFTFNLGINNPPISNVYFLPVGFSSNFAMDTIEENGKFYVLNFDLSGKAHLFSFGNSFLNIPSANYFGTITSNPSFANMYGIAGIKHTKGISFFSVNIFNANIFRTDFERNCGANPVISTAYNPAGVTYRNVGSHPVVLNIKDTNGNVIQRYEGTANINPTTTVGNFTANNVCLGNPVVFNNTSVGADSQVASWHWDFGDSNTSNLKNPTHTYTSAGTYNVTLTVNNLNGCSNSITKQVTVSAGVTADFQEVATACVGQAINFQNLSTYTNLPFDEANGFYWDFGDGTYSPFENPTKTYTTAGTYTITLTAKDQAGCTNTISKNITILNNPSVAFNVPTNICAGSPVQFTSVTSNASEFLWLFEGHGTSTEANPTITFSQAGFYDVTLQVKNSNNCINTFTVENIQVLPTPQIVFNAQRVPNNPLRIQFENFTAGGSQFLWDFGDGNTSTLFAPLHTYPQAGEYVVKLRATSTNGCVSEFEKIVGVGTLRPDVAVLTTHLANDKIVAEIANKGNTILNDITLQVQIADTTFTEIYAPTLFPNEQRQIILTLSLPNDILAKANYFCLKALPKTSVRDSDLSNNEACWNIKNNFVVFEPYPNPAQREINLSFTAPNEGTLNLDIQDVLGKTIRKSFVVSKGFNKETINIEGLAKGLYIFSFSFGDKIIHRKVVVE
jgi:PKD repeat protein